LQLLLANRSSLQFALMRCRQLSMRDSAIMLLTSTQLLSKRYSGKEGCYGNKKENFLISRVSVYMFFFGFVRHDARISFYQQQVFIQLYYFI
jgi:hypothetical protein